MELGLLVYFLALVELALSVYFLALVLYTLQGAETPGIK